MDALVLDVRYAARRIARSPGFAAAAILSIALGVAANTTIFSMVSRFVLRPPPVGEPATLMSIHTTQQATCCNHFTWPLFQDLRAQSTTFSGLAAYFELVPASIGGAGDPERVWGQGATTNFFDVGQFSMTLGRGFARDEEHSDVIVLGHDLWRRRFGADPGIAGKPVTVSGRTFTVIGVAPPGFHGVDQILYTQFWVPLPAVDELLPKTTDFRSRNYNWLAVIGRLRPGVSRDQAASELDVIARRAAKAYPEFEKDRGFRFEPAGSLPPRDRTFALMFLAALSVVVLLVLCIACANVANLLLSQGAGRRREMSVRLALGATRGQLIRQMLTESVILSLGGGLLGVVFSLWATSALSGLRLPAPVPLDIGVTLDWRTILFTFAISFGAGMVFGLAPALVAANPSRMEPRPGRRWTLRNVLVVAQISISLVLLCATGLFLRSLGSASGLDTGMRARDGLMLSIDPRLHNYSPQRTLQLLDAVRRNVAALPGVTSVAWTDVAPLSGGNRSDGFSVQGRSSVVDSPIVEVYVASAGYFDALGIRLLAGREFGNEDPAGDKVAIVSQNFATRLFHNENPIGRIVSGGGATYRIVGIVNDIKSRTLGEDLRPALFRTLQQSVASDPSMNGYTLLVRSGIEAGALTRSVRNEIRSLDPSLAIYNIQTMEQHFGDALFLPRLAGSLFGAFGTIGLVLAGVGLYGVMSYSVSRRTREMGIRVALGAQPVAVQRMLIAQGMELAGIAVVMGLAVAWPVAKYAASVLYGVRPHDPLTFLAAPVFLAIIALFACWIPARRARGVEPLEALRHE